jgi:hypothetical protein
MLNLTEGNEKAIMRGIFVLSGVIFYCSGRIRYVAPG